MRKKTGKGRRLGFAVLIGFAVVCFWRGVWGLLDEYLLPGDYRASLWVSLAAGVVILAMTNYAAKELM